MDAVLTGGEVEDGRSTDEKMAEFRTVRKSVVSTAVSNESSVRSAYRPGTDREVARRGLAEMMRLRRN